MPGHISWEEVLKREDLIGGDLELIHGDTVCRGPIVSITQEGYIIKITCDWGAQLSPESGEWEKIENYFCSIRSDVATPKDTGEGRVCFDLCMVGPVTLYPKGAHDLDPTEVKRPVTVPSKKETYF